MKIMKLMTATLVLLWAVTSCTLDKTDYEAELITEVPAAPEFQEVFTIVQPSFELQITALNGTFYKGYNALRMYLTPTNTATAIADATISFLPIHWNGNADATSCPHSQTLTYASDGYFEGYAVFDAETDATQSWEVYLTVNLGGTTTEIQQGVLVATQPNHNLNMTRFTGHDGALYYLALVSPSSPTVGENEIVAGLYQYQEPELSAGDFPDASQFVFTEVNGATLLIDPRMPEPSMGNHSSPNNQDLTQRADGYYAGVVNYTMTGNWTLNFIFQDEQESVIYGTEVPTDFTPGVAGVKSELYIDTLF